MKDWHQEEEDSTPAIATNIVMGEKEHPGVGCRLPGWPPYYSEEVMVETAAAPRKEGLELFTSKALMGSPV